MAQAQDLYTCGEKFAFRFLLSHKVNKSIALAFLTDSVPSLGAIVGRTLLYIAHSYWDNWGHQQVSKGSLRTLYGMIVLHYGKIFLTLLFNTFLYLM